MNRKFALSIPLALSLVACGSETSPNNVHAELLRADIASFGLEAPSASEQARGDAERTADDVGTHTRRAADELGQAATDAKGAVERDSRTVWHKTKSFGRSTRESIGDAMSNGYGHMRHGARRLGRGISDSFSAVGDKLSSMFGRTRDKARDAKNTVANKSERAWDKTKQVGHDAKENVKEVGHNVKQAAQDAGHAVANKTDEAASRAHESANNAAAAVRDTAHDARQSAEGSARRAADDARAARDRAADGARDTAERAADATRDAADRTADGARDAADRAHDAARDGVERTQEAGEAVRGSAERTADDIAHDAGEAVSSARNTVGDAIHERRAPVRVAGTLRRDRDDAVELLALHVCLSYAENNEMGEGYEYADVEACKADHRGRFADYLEVPECDGVQTFDEQVVKQCAGLAYNKDFAFAPLTAEAFRAECSPEQICTSGASKLPGQAFDAIRGMTADELETVQEQFGLGG